MAEPMTITHPDFGTIRGNISDGVVQLKGIQYATLVSRFATPQLKHYTGDTVLDATKLGPQVLSIAPGPKAELGLIQHNLPYNQDELSMSDTHGLCLNIAMPANVSLESKLPVFVFIHGGGFMVGSGCWPQYDMSRFVRLSIEAGTPIVAVVMNYRLGGPGLLYSTSAAWQQAGFKANNSLHDQRTALRWVQKYIGGFDGDAENVTIAGESAGAVSVCYQLFAEERLFQRIVAMSGTHLLLPPMHSDEAEVQFRKAYAALGLNEGEEVQVTSEMDGIEMVGKLMSAGIRLSPVVDGEIVPRGFDVASFQAGSLDIPALRWCKGAMIGDCQFDGSIRALDLGARKVGIAKAFCASMESSFSSHEAIVERLLTAYDIDPETPDDDAFERVLQVANDLNFYAPTVIVAEYLRTHQAHLRNATYVYQFNTPNPWPGPWQGRSTHILDITFLFQNFSEYLSPEDKDIATGFGKDVIAFVNGKPPWSVDRPRTYGAVGGVQDVKDVPEETGRRKVMLELAENAGWDRLNAAFAAFAKPVEKNAPSM